MRAEVTIFIGILPDLRKVLSTSGLFDLSKRTRQIIGKYKKKLV